MTTPKSDACYTLHHLTVEMAVIKEQLRGNKEALQVASLESERRFLEHAGNAYALQKDLVKLSEEVAKIKTQFVARELHDKLAEELDQLRQNLSNWQGRLLMMAWVITGLMGIAGTVVTIWHMIPR